MRADTDTTCGYRWPSDYPNQPHVCGLDANHWPQDHKCMAFLGLTDATDDYRRCGATKVGDA